MDTSKIKGFAQILGVFKDYSSLLTAAVIGLVAVLFLVLTPLLMGSKLKKKITVNSIAMGDEIGRLSKNAVARAQWKEEQKYQQDYANDANQIALLAKQSTQRELLSYRIFPEPRDTSTLIFEEFGHQFREGIEGLLARVNARDCPTEAELDGHLRDSLGSGFRGERSIRGGWRVSSQDSGGIETKIVMDALCREKAESASVYANPTDSSGYEFWAQYEYSGSDEAVNECWYWQLAYWIIEDVINTIDAVNSNSGSNSVLTSPVKRLLNVGFIRGGRTYSGFRRGRAVGGKPSYVLSIEDGLTTSCTGRVCNDDIDVVHFNVAVIVSTKAVLPFMKQLCSAKGHKFRGFFGEAEEPRTFRHNQITILESEIEPIDREAEVAHGHGGDIETHSLYRYGEDAVAKLNLICEYIFNKNGYDQIKPKSVKELLKAPGPKLAPQIPTIPQTAPKAKAEPEKKPKPKPRIPKRKLPGLD